MEAKVIWQQNLRFTGVTNSNVELGLNSPAGKSPEGDMVSPMELILVGLVGCTAMDVISILQKKRLKVEEFIVSVTAERAEDHPKVYTKADIEYFIKGEKIEREAVQRAVDLSADKYCSVMAMLSKAFPITQTIRIA